MRTNRWLDHDAVAAAVSHTHHLIIRVGAGPIPFVYGSHSCLAADLILHKVLFSPFLSRAFPSVVGSQQGSGFWFDFVPGFELHVAWIWTDFLSEQHQATGLVETAGRAARAGGKRQPARCSRKTQNKFAIDSMAKKFLHRCIGAHARVHVHFLRRVCMHFDRCCEHHACADVYVKQVLCASAYKFAYTLATGCAYVLMYV